MNLFRLAQAALAGWIPFGQRHCVLCGHDVWLFMPYRGGSKVAPSLMRSLDAVGSDADNFGCPRCFGHDRERHLLMYLQAAGLLADMHGKMIVHFAPEKRLWRKIAATNPARYVRCDLYPTSPDITRVDMLAMDFESGSVDLMIANHVLEHVADDRQALAEIRRVLKVGGHAVLQTPYARKLHHTWEDPGIADGAARLQAYGQADHVRLYGRDIFDRFTAAGFESCVRQHAELLPDIDAYKFGVNRAEPFFLFRRV